MELSGQAFEPAHLPVFQLGSGRERKGTRQVLRNRSGPANLDTRPLSFRGQLKRCWRIGKRSAN